VQIGEQTQNTESTSLLKILSQSKHSKWLEEIPYNWGHADETADGPFGCGPQYQANGLSHAVHRSGHMSPSGSLLEHRTDNRLAGVCVTAVVD
jgi:hypothetical protein